CVLFLVCFCQKVAAFKGRYLVMPAADEGVGLAVKNNEVKSNPTKNTERNFIVSLTFLNCSVGVSSGASRLVLW
ncbi:MAG: hypothetical protein RSE47_08465, partial [Acidaminococcaceae bacterium]